MGRRRDKSRNRNHVLPPMRQGFGKTDAAKSTEVQFSEDLEEALNDTFPASDPISELSSLVAGRPGPLSRLK
jgi:hypothetical protein